MCWIFLSGSERVSFHSVHSYPRSSLMQLHSLCVCACVSVCEDLLACVYTWMPAWPWRRKWSWCDVSFSRMEFSRWCDLHILSACARMRTCWVAGWSQTIQKGWRWRYRWRKVAGNEASWGNENRKWDVLMMMMMKTIWVWWGQNEVMQYQICSVPLCVCMHAWCTRLNTL